MSRVATSRRAPCGWQVIAWQEASFPYGVTAPPQWTVTAPALPRKAAEALALSRDCGDVSWSSYGTAHLSRVTVTAEEARLILSGADPLAVLLPSFLVRVLGRGELMAR